MEDKLIKPVRLTLLFLLPFLLALIVLLSLIIIWEKRKIDDEQIAELKEVSRAVFDQVMVARLWNAGHGGVYVEVSPETQPNPYLDIEERDITTVTGKECTMINPSYMTRQLSDISMQKSGYKFRLVSSMPLNPSNVPDKWESAVLRDFEKRKAVEAMTVYAGDDGKRYFKYLAPLKIEDPCLKCHAKQGYSVGDVKGGLNIIVPMETSDLLHSLKIRRNIFYLLLIGVVSALFIAAITFILSRKLNDRIKKDIEHEKLTAIIEVAGATAHEMRQPMTIVYNLVALLKDKIKGKATIKEDEMTVVIDQCERMNNIIKKMLHITRYRTKDYVKGKKIVDLDEASKVDEDK